MNLLSYFRWYRRARGGYWAQVTLPFIGVRWLRVADQPPPNHEWTFWPWGTRTLGNGYIDEWHMDGFSATPLSMALNAAVGTADPQEIKKMRDLLGRLRGYISSGPLDMEVATILHETSSKETCPVCDGGPSNNCACSCPKS